MLRLWLELYMPIKWHNGYSQWAGATPHKSTPVFPNLTMAWTILCSGAVGRRPPFDEWVRRSIHSFLVAANEMRGRVCDWYRPWRHMGTSGSVHFWVRRPCVSDIMRSAGRGTRHPVVAGKSRLGIWLQRRKDWGTSVGQEGGSAEQQVNIFSRQVAGPHWWPCFVCTV